MASAIKKIKEYNYYRIMSMIEDDQLLTYRKISKLIGVSTGSAFNLMTYLIKNGYVNVENVDEQRVRKKYLYSLSSIGVRRKAILAKNLLDLKQGELEELQKELIALKKDVGYVSED